MFEIKSVTKTEKSTEKSDSDYITTVLKSTTDTSNIQQVIVRSNEDIGSVGNKLDVKITESGQQTLKPKGKK